MKRRPRVCRTGFTLVELLVYMLLFGLCMSAVYYVLTACMSYFNTTQATVDVQNSALRAVMKLSADLAESNATTVTTLPSPGPPMAIAFASPRDLSDTYNFVTSGGSVGQPMWEKFVCYYVDTTNPNWPLMRKQVSIAASSTPPAPGSNDTASALMSSTSSGFKEQVSQNVTGFYCTISGNVVTINFTADAMDGAGNVLTQVGGGTGRTPVATFISSGGAPQNEIQLKNVQVFLRN
jgi:prepilin-type N-terminal cleavage/methylation domain-containing protein